MILPDFGINLCGKNSKVCVFYEKNANILSQFQKCNIFNLFFSARRGITFTRARPLG
jgi:hypothetical protein